MNRSWPLRFTLSKLAKASECWTPGLIELALSSLHFVEKPEDQRELLSTFLSGLATCRWRFAGRPEVPPVPGAKPESWSGCSEN